MQETRATCRTCRCWIVADMERCTEWLSEHPLGHESWRVTLHRAQDRIWGADLERVLAKADAKRLRRLEKSKRKRAKNLFET